MCGCVIFETNFIRREKKFLFFFSNQPNSFFFLPGKKFDIFFRPGLHENFARWDRPTPTQLIKKIFILDCTIKNSLPVLDTVTLIF